MNANIIPKLFIIICLFGITYSQGFSSDEKYGIHDSIKVYIFMLDDCPICIQYTQEIQSIYTDFNEIADIIMVFPNLSSKPAKIESFKEKFGLSVPHKTDYFKSLVKKFDIKVTPEVVVFDVESESILYKGRIDNTFEDLGQRRRVVTTQELREVLKDLTDGRKSVFPFTKAIGCMIEWHDHMNIEKNE